MTKEVTIIAPPVYLAQLSGVYRIDVGARVVKAYRCDGSISYRVFLARLPKNFITADFMEQVALIKANAKRQPS